jgi:hypothetical protein
MSKQYKWEQEEKELLKHEITSFISKIEKRNKKLISASRVTVQEEWRNRRMFVIGMLSSEQAERPNKGG